MSPEGLVRLDQPNQSNDMGREEKREEGYMVDIGHYIIKIMLDDYWKEVYKKNEEFRAQFKRVFERDGELCFYCGELPEYPELDHRFPKVKGGGEEDENKVISCRPCNRRKRHSVSVIWKNNKLKNYMVDKENKYRKHELEKYSSVGVTEESYKILREQKTKQSKSMMRLVDDLIKETYAKNKPIRTSPDAQNAT